MNAYLPIDALNHGYHYETLKVRIPDESFTIPGDDGEEDEYSDTLADLWYSQLDNTIRNNLSPKSFWIEDKWDRTIYANEKVIADSKLVQVRTAFYLHDWVIVIVRETPHNYKQYIHNLSGIHVNRITAELKDRLTKLGYEVS